MHVPASLLGCKAISREMTFSSVELMDKFRLEQRIFLHGQVRARPAAAAAAAAAAATRHARGLFSPLPTFAPLS